MNTTAENIEIIARFMKDLNMPESDRLTITPESDLTKDLGLNSLSVLLLFVWIKDHVNKDIFDYAKNLGSFKKVGDVLALIDRCRGANALAEVQAT